ncbi:response regulator [Bacillus sp. 03113]|uniref:response regulator n=1 Tax=Bacillus sp. 03113 TaxID=2578211 RepID=UPI0011429700|nr:response regulator [Bacillus sp. 03113]
MYQLVIVDDEKIVIDGLISLIDWKQFQIEIIGSASNGHEAYQCIIEKIPQIVLADIQMPGLNGLDLMSKVKKVYPQIEFIIISGYTEFEYAQKALKLEAIDYLVKPIEINDIINSIKKTVEKIKKHHTEKTKIEQIQKYKSDSEKKDILDIILGRSVDFTKRENPHKTYQILTIGHKDLLWNFYINEKFQEILKDLKRFFAENGHNAFIFLIEEIIVVLLSNTNKKPFHDSKLISISTILQKNTKVLPFIGLSNIYKEWANTHKSYKESKEAFQMGIFFNQVITYYSHLQKNNDTVMKQIIIDIEDHFKKQEVIFDQIYPLLDQILITSIENKIYPDKSKYIYYLFIQSFSKYIQHNFDLDIERILGEKIQIFESINGFRSIQDINYWIKSLISRTIQYLDENKISYKEKLIGDVKNYLNSNFDQCISLDDIGKCFHISPAYISSIFSKLVGVTIFDYMTEIRVTRAKVLLRTTNEKIHKICQQVGYENPRYFNHVFKKKVGKSPTEYRSEHFLVNHR